MQSIKDPPRAHNREHTTETPAFAVQRAERRRLHAAIVRDHLAEQAADDPMAGSDTSDAEDSESDDGGLDDSESSDSELEDSTQQRRAVSVCGLAGSWGGLSSFYHTRGR